MLNKYLIFIALVLVNVSVSFSQEETTVRDGLLSNLDLKVDTSIFNGRNGMFYYNKSDQSIVMIASIAPQEYLIASKQLLEKENEKRDIKVLSVKNNLFEGTRSLLQVGTIIKDGVKLHTYTYLIEYSKNQTFFLFGCTKSNDERHIKAFYEAAESILNKTK